MHIKFNNNSSLSVYYLLVDNKVNNMIGTQTETNLMFLIQRIYTKETRQAAES